ncbi:MAG: excinuclease ABC subunit UvrC [Verrucomicrobia bacterium]|nr:excinuclease ABC subunit UvrC [Verrucomicrobiota bacterium]
MLIEKIQKFPQEPGVYLMKDKAGKVLYVGKAINLRARVKQYFTGADERSQIPYLLPKVAHIEVLVVHSEKEALLLENTLIKQYVPPYNVILKDDKSYASLKISTRHPWPILQLVRQKGKGDKDSIYFGPYTSTYAARQTLEMMRRLFPLRRCSDAELLRRTRPCILYEMKRCVAPCVAKCTKEDYDLLVKRAVRFLQGQDKEVVQELYQEMERASEHLEFERAADIHQLIQQIEQTVERQRVDQAGMGDLDLFGIYREGAEVCVSQMFFREGKLVGAKHHHFTKVAQEETELLCSLLLQLYQEAPSLPHEALIPVELAEASTLSQIVSEGKKRRLQLHTPQKGDKKQLIKMAEANAKAAFHQERDVKAIRENTLLQLQEKLDLKNYPRRIECFDNSHLQGSSSVASMVAYTDGEADRRRYRKFKLKGEADDYGNMREALLRRLKRAQDEEDLPDLIILDGGKGHLKIASEVVQELHIVTLDFIAIAKEEGRHDRGITAEKVYLPNVRDPLSFKPHSPQLLLLQRIRDEAHRFAIAFHRQQRAKAFLKGPLDNIPGIGPVKRKALLRHFGSAKKALAATEEELKAVKNLTARDIATLLEIAKIAE